ncbi:hypothetical protein LBBP_03353 [Leptospira borgpetersenii serovar Ballum]|uniref:Uncharacterized protein n=1 Tax=Leptospira borgpetersenii serovar Ballum TaxID=280505 RepID=A0A0S2IVP0_LEPBO|nr:hypothetical protein LBBP_03353 [Leptospira borgpetersenii serovar Ballum]
MIVVGKVFLNLLLRSPFLHRKSLSQKFKGNRRQAFDSS